MEGKKIESVLELGEGIVLMKMDDNTYVSAKILDPEIPNDEVEEFLSGSKPKKEPKKEKGEPKEGKSESRESKKDDDDPLTMEDLEGMKKKALVKLIEDRNLLVDPDEFDDDDEGLRKAIADELGIDEDDDSGKGKEGKDDDSYTWEDLVEMDYDELSDLCKENKLDTDPDDFEEGEDEDKFRRAIAKECEIETPAKKKK